MFNHPFDSSTSLSGSVVDWGNYCVLQKGDFRLYQVPENVNQSAADCQESNDSNDSNDSSIVDVTSSVVIGTWCHNRSGGNGSGGNGSVKSVEETIAFCMVHVHMQHAIERLLSPLPRGMILTKRPPFDDLHDCRGIRGYTIVLSLRSFARCCWETQCSQFDVSSATLRGCLLENGQLSWDQSLHFGLEPSLLCRTPCFTTKVDNACVVEVTMYDEHQNVVLGSIDVVQIQPLEQLLEQQKRNHRNPNQHNTTTSNFWQEIRQQGSFGATIDLQSRCGIEIQSKVGIVQIGMCRVLADQSDENVLAVERLEVGIHDKWRKEWFG